MSNVEPIVIYRPDTRMEYFRVCKWLHLFIGRSSITRSIADGWREKKKRYLHAAEPESRCRAEYAEKRKKSGSLFYCKRVSPMNGFSANGKTVRGRREAGKRARKSLSRRRRSESVVANIDLRNKFSLDDVYHSVADCG
ncbi:hypothetical protein U1Q18_052134 [Sarracenia purpurea var. burkii]